MTAQMKAQKGLTTKTHIFRDRERSSEGQNTWRNVSANATISCEDKSVGDAPALEVTSHIKSIHPSSVRDLGGSRATKGKPCKKSSPTLKRFSEPRDAKSAELSICQLKPITFV